MGNNAVIEFKILESNTGLLVLKGQLSNTTHDEISNAIDKLLEKKMENLIIDCTKVVYITSAGVATFIAIARELKKKGGYKTRIVKLNSEILEVFDAVGLSKRVEYYSDVESALKGL
ncbi:MAG: STAS domain-containing protein [Leptospiraceae bacterium]|nr:STAS domain-containing protein [Leptospiraceae bacterium]